MSAPRPDTPGDAPKSAVPLRTGRAAAPLFLARQSYRRRRLADAARALPVVAAGLFFLPVLWQPAATPEPDTARGAVWLFSTWAAIIVVAWVIAWRLARRRDDPSAPSVREDA